MMKILLLDENLSPFPFSNILYQFFISVFVLNKKPPKNGKCSAVQKSGTGLNTSTEGLDHSLL